MPSSIAQLGAAVAEVTGHTADYCIREMSLAAARQYEQIFFARKGYDCQPPGGTGRLSTVI